MTICVYCNEDLWMFHVWYPHIIIKIIYCLILVYFIQSHTGTNLKNASLQKLLDILYTDTVIEDLDYIFKFGNTVLCNVHTISKSCPKLAPNFLPIMGVGPVSGCNQQQPSGLICFLSFYRHRPRQV